MTLRWLTASPLTHFRSVHCHSPLNLAQPLPFTYSAPSLQTSFYSRLALSPCGSYLASGSARGDVHMWEVGGSLASRPTEGAEREGIRLDFHSRSAAVLAGQKRMEVGSVSWSASGVRRRPLNLSWLSRGK